MYASVTRMCTRCTAQRVGILSASIRDVMIGGTVNSNYPIRCRLDIQGCVITSYDVEEVKPQRISVHVKTVNIGLIHEVRHVLRDFSHSIRAYARLRLRIYLADPAVHYSLVRIPGLYNASHDHEVLYQLSLRIY